jgi:hypothetical protein
LCFLGKLLLRAGVRVSARCLRRATHQHCCNKSRGKSRRDFVDLQLISPFCFDTNWPPRRTDFVLPSPIWTAVSGKGVSSSLKCGHIAVQHEFFFCQISGYINALLRQLHSDSARALSIRASWGFWAQTEQSAGRETSAPADPAKAQHFRDMDLLLLMNAARFLSASRFRLAWKRAKGAVEQVAA